MIWGQSKSKAISNVMEELTRPTLQDLYDPHVKTKVSLDASSFGLGAVLYNRAHKQEWKPNAYALRPLTDTE